MIPFARLSIAAATSIALTSAFLLSANSASAYVIDGGQTLNINDQITTNNESVLLYSGTVNLNPGGIIGNSLYLMYGDSVANFVGGTIENFAYLNNGVLNISSGDIRNDVTAGISTWANGQPMGLGQVNIYGGNFMNPNGFQYLLHALGKGRLDVYGGNLTNRKLFAQQTGAIYIHGSDFNYDYGILPTRTGTLSGTLLSGETFGMDFETIGLGSVHLIAAVPEPSTCFSLAAGLVFGCWHVSKGRRRRTAAVISRPVVVLLLVAGGATTSPTYAVNYEMVTVGDAGNAADTTSYGAVPYEYQIGKYEVTIGQYCEFLNAVATTDLHDLYDSSMSVNQKTRGIARSNTTGSYVYSVVGPSGVTPAGAASAGDRPITYVSWFGAARFANWMSNGQPTGAQGPTTSENGAYPVNGATASTAVTVPARNSTNPNTGNPPLYLIPTEDEWFKAAYYAGGGTNAGYWTYATQSNSPPGNVMGNGINQANYLSEYDGSGAVQAMCFAVTRTMDFSSNQNLLTDVGAFANSASHYGTFDQNGNVSEWFEQAELPFGQYTRGIRGGYFSMTAQDMRRQQGRPYDSGYLAGVGFRLAAPIAVPEPSTCFSLAAGLAIGYLGLRCRRTSSS